MNEKYEEVRELILKWMNEPGEYDENMWPEVQKILEKGRIMDKKIKSAKASIDKKMNNLVKEDIKRDKKCEHDEMMAKKAKKK